MGSNRGIMRIQTAEMLRKLFEKNEIIGEHLFEPAIFLEITVKNKKKTRKEINRPIFFKK